MMMALCWQAAACQQHMTRHSQSTQQGPVAAESQEPPSVPFMLHPSAISHGETCQPLTPENAQKLIVLGHDILAPRSAGTLQFYVYQH